MMKLEEIKHRPIPNIREVVNNYEQPKKNLNYGKEEITEKEWCEDMTFLFRLT